MILIQTTERCPKCRKPLKLIKKTGAYYCEHCEIVVSIVRVGPEAKPQVLRIVPAGPDPEKAPIGPIITYRRRWREP